MNRMPSLPGNKAPTPPGGQAEGRPVGLNYVAAPRTQRRGWVARSIDRLSRPMPLAMYCVMMFALSVAAVAIMILIKAIIDAVR